MKNFNLKFQNCDILFEMFWKNALNLFSLKPHIFFIVSSFWVIKKVMNVPTSYLWDFFESQMQLNNDKTILSQNLNLFQQIYHQTWTTLHKTTHILLIP
jgi:hypothetical protein